MPFVANVVIDEQLGLLDRYPEDTTAAGETWAVSFFGETPSISVYTLECNSWATLDDVLYGADENGVHALDDDTGQDRGVDFTAGVLLAPGNFGTELPKSIRRVVVDGEGDMDVGAHVGSYQTPFTAGTTSYGKHIFPRTTVGQLWLVGVEGFTELRNIEIQAAVLPRRRS